ncbi:flagellin [Agrobacterium vitis]|nr:flagellin [Allorhizobium ampelinum]MUO30408.1 flagellin [Agrobacterium vitis]MUO42421.1 flagellin [Agrobacterium vitis]MUP10390.1 flagellin [Agrobacterium vitis]
MLSSIADGLCFACFVLSPFCTEYVSERMTSKNTNVAAYTALQSLRHTVSSRDDSQARVTTGYRVATAADDAAYWSIATTMRSDNRSLSAVQDALSMAAGVLDTAESGMSTSTDLMMDVKARLVLAREGGTSRDKINTELDEIRDQFRSIAESSSFSKENWLLRSSTSDKDNRNLVGSFVRDGEGRISINTIDYNVGGDPGTSEVNYLIDDLDGEGGILTGSGFATELGTAKTWVMFNGSKASTTHDEIRLEDSTTNADIDDMIKVVDAMAERMNGVASTLGAMSNRVEMQYEFSKDLQGSISKGVGNMVDTDMNLESSRLKALQAKEQLGIKSLSIVNTSVQSLSQLL